MLETTQSRELSEFTADTSEPPEPVPVIRPGMSTAEILSVAVAIDEGLITPSDDDHRMLAEQLRAKPDGIRYVVDELTDQAKRHRDYAREHSEAARTAEARVEKLKAYVSWAMRHFGFEKLTGEQWQISLTRSESVDIAVTPDENTWRNAPEFVRAKFEWSLSAIKTSLKEGTFPFTFATITEKFSPRFTAAKGKIK
jgi:hypothetical protein